ncbi:MAG: hypothetical protein PHD63_06480 [Candidatus Marinimicrobia bacterium]|nr:hypothetical protein [Candidatus Neomarinimicrobiota bacterium]
MHFSVIKEEAVALCQIKTEFLFVVGAWRRAFFLVWAVVPQAAQSRFDNTGSGIVLLLYSRMLCRLLSASISGMPPSRCGAGRGIRSAGLFAAARKSAVANSMIITPVKISCIPRRI